MQLGEVESPGATPGGALNASLTQLAEYRTFNPTEGVQVLHGVLIYDGSSK